MKKRKKSKLRFRSTGSGAIKNAQPANDQHVPGASYIYSIPSEVEGLGRMQGFVDDFRRHDAHHVLEAIREYLTHGNTDGAFEVNAVAELLAVWGKYKPGSVEWWICSRSFNETIGSEPIEENRIIWMKELGSWIYVVDGLNVGDCMSTLAAIVNGPNPSPPKGAGFVFADGLVFVQDGSGKGTTYFENKEIAWASSEPRSK